MRIARFEHGTETRTGVVSDGETIAPLRVEVQVLDLLAADPAGRERIVEDAADGDPVGRDAVRLLAPLEPPSIRDFVTFEEHVEGVVKSVGDDAEVVPEWYEAPQFYFTNPHAVLGPADEVPIPPGCKMLDFELEVAAIVGRAGQDLSAEQAREHIAGYTIFNDWSARDLQRREMRVGLGPAKGKDSANTLGPWIVTADELEPHRRDGRLDLDLRVAINGEPFGDDTLANMGWSFEEMVAYASRGTWVRPGDVLGSGTCGSGCLAEIWGRRGAIDPRPLEPGDVVAITVEGIGTLSSRLVAGAEPIAIPPARPGTRRRRPWDA